MAHAKWLDRLDDRAELAAAALVLGAAGLVFAGVVMRNVFTTSPSWIAELPVHLIVWAVFLALAASFSRGAELGLDILVRRLPLRVQWVLDRLGALAMLVIAVMLVWLGIELARRQYTMGAVTASAARTPLWLITSAMPVGCAMLALHAAARLAGRERFKPADEALPIE
jgi:TRAP-type C4-dicarboxylate transport system permease small subunit